MQGKTCWLSEIFPSVQGEGLFVGQPQIFVRLAGCNIGCRYCDTRDALERGRFWYLRSAEDRNGKKFRNPVASEKILETIGKLMRKNVSTVCITGGEPLMQADFLADFLPRLKHKGARIYFETAGLYPAALGMIVRYVDTIAMDWKLSSTSGLSDLTTQHEAFLKVAIKKDVFVKSVVCKKTKPSEIIKMAETIATVKRAVPLVIQPCWPWNDGNSLFKTVEIASAYLNDVRLIPQLHRIIFRDAALRGLRNYAKKG